MKIRYIKNIIPRFVCWILLLQIINISIDPADLKQVKNVPVSSKEDLSINEIESLYELISENVFESDVPETDDNDIDIHSITFDLYCSNTYFSTQVIFNHPMVHYCYYQNSLLSEFSELNFPPPKYV